MVRFECKAGSGISMLEKHAKQLLELMKQSGEIPSAILAEDISTCLENLQSAVRDEASLYDASEGQVESKPPSEAAESGLEKELPVTLSTRAYPLIELLKEAKSKEEMIIWDHDNSIL